MTYDNIKSPQKPGSHPLFRRCIFEKTKGGNQIDLPSPSPRQASQWAHSAFLRLTQIMHLNH